MVTLTAISRNISITDLETFVFAVEVMSFLVVTVFRYITNGPNNQGMIELRDWVTKNVRRFLVLGAITALSYIYETLVILQILTYLYVFLRYIRND
jgi:hypothetical protein